MENNDLILSHTYSSLGCNIFNDDMSLSHASHSFSEDDTMIMHDFKKETSKLTFDEEKRLVIKRNLVRLKHKEQMLKLDTFIKSNKPMTKLERFLFSSVFTIFCGSIVFFMLAITH